MSQNEYYDKVNSDSFSVGQNVLECFKNSNHQIFMNLSGGALRDLILDKETEIKDLDFILSFEDLCKKRVEKIENGGLGLEDVIVFYNDNLEMLKNHFKNKGYDVQFHKNFTKEMCVFDKDNPEDDIYAKLENLMGVLKIKGNGLNYDVDILFVLDIQNYINAFFDFNICKVQSGVIVNNKIQESAENLIENGLESSKAKNCYFLEDIKNKTITYDVKNKKESDIINSFQKHLPRINKKYPEYEVMLEFERKLQYEVAAKDEKGKEEQRLRELSKSLRDMFLMNLELEKVEIKVTKKVKKF